MGLFAGDINGQPIYDDFDERGDPCDGPNYNRRRPRDPLYYHRPMFQPDEQPRIVHETARALLIAVTNGQFWCPKSLIRRQDQPMAQWMIYTKFRRRYIPTSTENPCHSLTSSTCRPA